MSRNNADARQCSYFELGLPVARRNLTVLFTTRRTPLRVSLACARSLFHPLLPSACYAGYLITSNVNRL